MPFPSSSLFAVATSRCPFPSRGKQSPAPAGHSCPFWSSKRITVRPFPRLGAQLRPSKWRYFSCPFVSFLLSWRFYLNSRKPSQFLHWFRKIFPKLTNPSPFARLKLKEKSSPPMSGRCPQPPTQPDLWQRARVNVTCELWCWPVPAGFLEEQTWR